MNWKGLLSTGLLLCIVTVSLFFFSNGEATTTLSRCAVIVVSDHDGFEEDELVKADQFYEYLKDEGYSDDDIFFLTEENRSGYDDDPNVDNFRDAFHWLRNKSVSTSKPVIYVYDHVLWSCGNVRFQFSDGNVTTDMINEWLDSIFYQDLTMVIGGERSGLAGPELDGDFRDIICSMRSDQFFNPDLFNITRSLEDISADTDQDGKVSYVEAYWKEVENLQGEDQDPILFT